MGLTHMFINALSVRQDYFNAVTSWYQSSVRDPAERWITKIDKMMTLTFTFDTTAQINNNIYEIIDRKTDNSLTRHSVSHCQ